MMWVEELKTILSKKETSVRTYYIRPGNEKLFSALLVPPPLLIASFPGSHNNRDPGMGSVGRGCALQHKHPDKPLKKCPDKDSSFPASNDCSVFPGPGLGKKRNPSMGEERAWRSWVNGLVTAYV